jgi:hypothetical protein
MFVFNSVGWIFAFIKNLQSNSQKLIIPISALVPHINEIENLILGLIFFLFPVFKIKLNSSPVLIKLDLNLLLTINSSILFYFKNLGFVST